MGGKSIMEILLFSISLGILFEPFNFAYQMFKQANLVLPVNESHVLCLHYITDFIIKGWDVNIQVASKNFAIACFNWRGTDFFFGTVLFRVVKFISSFGALSRMT